MLDCHLYGLNPSGHHTTNLIIHISNTLLLFILFFRMTGAAWQSAFISALFAIHTLHAESVAWVSERRDVLYGFFWILTVLTYLYYVKAPKPRRYLLVVFCFILAMMSKPMAVTLPFILLLIDYWPLHRFRSPGFDYGQYQKFTTSSNRDLQKLSAVRLISEKISLFILAAALSFFTIFVNSRVGALSAFAQLPLKVRLENAVVSYVRYIVKMFWPNRLAVLYPHPIHLPFLEVALATLSLSVATFMVFWAGRKRPYVIVGWLWYLAALLPAIGLIQSGVQAMADRFTYIPLIGLFIIVVFGVSDTLTGWRYKNLTFAATGMLLLFALMISTGLRVQTWRNSVTLFRNTLSVTVQNYVIHNNLGVTLARQGKDDEAAVHYKRALAINPRYSDAHYNLAALLARQGEDQEAMGHFVEALKAKPDSAIAHNDLGVLLAKHGKIQDAIFHFAEAIRINPNFGETYFNSGTALVRHGRNKEAIPYFNEALRINPSDDKVHNNLAVALAAVGRTEEAIGVYNQALKINPDNTDAHYNLGSLFILQGRHHEAISHYYEILRVHPTDARAHYELGAILARMKKNQEAVVHLTEAIQIAPNFGEAHLALGIIYLEIGRKNLAFERYKILRAINKELAQSLYKKISEHKN